MDLKPCPECRREVPRTAVICPVCGCEPTGTPPAPISELDDRLLEMLACEGETAAIKLYRAETPAASLADATQYVERLADTHPFTYSAPEEDRLRSNLVASIYISILFLTLFVLWFVEPRMHRAWQQHFQQVSPPPTASPADSAP